MAHFESAIITGASRGLGRALLLALTRNGVACVGVARGRGELDAAVAEARAFGGNAHGIAADVGAPGAATLIALEAAGRVGDVDLLIHGASSLGPVPLRPLADVTEPELLSVLATNVAGPLLLTRAVVGGMVLRGRGTILFVSSDAAVEAYPGWGPYGATKAAADHAARVLAVELAGTGVDVLCVDPGEMDTDMHRAALPDADPSSLAAPETVASQLLRILDDRTRFPSGSRCAARDAAA